MFRSDFRVHIGENAIRLLGLAEPRSSLPTARTSPPISPAAIDQTQQQEKHDSADEGIQNCSDNADAQMDPQSRMNAQIRPTSKSPTNPNPPPSITRPANHPAMIPTNRTTSKL